MKILKRAFTALVCLGAATALATPATAASPEPSQPSASAERTVVARVNSQPIYQDQLTPLVESNLRSHRKRGLTPDNPAEDLLEGLRKKALQRVIATELVYQEACKLEIPDLEEKVARAIAHRQARKPGAASADGDPKIADMARRQVVINAYLEQNGLANPQVPEAEVKAYYENNKARFAAIADEVWVRHILISVPEDASDATREEARETIEKTRRLILDGTSFEEVAKEYSEDFTAEKGGELGKVERGFMPPEFDEVAFSIELNTLSEVVETKYGFHILKVVARRLKGDISPFERVQGIIAKLLQPEHANRALAAHVKELGAQAKIENLLEQQQTP